MNNYLFVIWNSVTGDRHTISIAAENIELAMENIYAALEAVGPGSNHIQSIIAPVPYTASAEVKAAVHENMFDEAKEQLARLERDYAMAKLHCG